MKNTLILIASLFLISACGDPKTNESLFKEGHADVSKFVNFPNKMKNCELHKLIYNEPSKANIHLYTVICPNSTVSTHYTQGKEDFRVSVSTGDLTQQVSSEKDKVTELFKSKINFLDNLNLSTINCTAIENKCHTNDSGYQCSDTIYYSCSVTQSKIVDNKIVENLVSMKCNTSECIL